MQPLDLSSDQTITLEAPGVFLSELLGVSRACMLPLKRGALRVLAESPGAWYILSPLSGGLRVAAGESALPLEPGQAAALPGAEELSLLPSGDGALALLELRGSVADRLLCRYREEGGLFFARGGPAVERMLRVFAVHSHRLFPAREASAEAYRLLMDLYGTGSPGPSGQRVLPPVVEAALGIIRRDYAFLEGIGELAVRLEVSQEYLTRCFCKYTGVTPGKYLNQVRIENAKLLLRQGQHSVQFVSDACGFANANYFARVFRQSVGVNPRDYARKPDAPDGPDAGEDRLYVL